MRAIALVLLAAVIVLEGCGGGGGGDAPSPYTPRTVVDTPPAVEPEPPVVVPPVLDIKWQMSPPPECETTATSTGDPDRNFITCEGVPITDLVSYPHSDSTEIAVIEILAIWDSNMTSGDMDFLGPVALVQRELDHANKVFKDSGVHIELHLAGLDAVDVAKGDLRRQYRAFTEGTDEFSEVERWQREQGADYSFLFKRRYDDAIACGVAVLDAVREESGQRRGITQCYQGDTFQSTEASRYYERAGETFVHEMGHLLGLEHDIASATYTPAFSFSYGHLLGESYGTIMSYSDKGVGRFSDPTQYVFIPELNYQVPLGTQAADAVAHLNRVRYYMSQLHERYDR